MRVPSDWKEFVECLNRANVEYLLVGGYAVAFHGLPRLTKDVDFLVRCNLENAKRIVQALEDFGFGPLNVTTDDLSNPGSFVILGHSPNRIDLITAVDGLEFDEAWTRICRVTLTGLRYGLSRRRI